MSNASFCNFSFIWHGFLSRFLWAPYRFDVLHGLVQFWDMHDYSGTTYELMTTYDANYNFSIDIQPHISWDLRWSFPVLHTCFVLIGFGACAVTCSSQKHPLRVHVLLPYFAIFMWCWVPAGRGAHWRNNSDGQTEACMQSWWVTCSNHFCWMRTRGECDSTVPWRECCRDAPTDWGEAQLKTTQFHHLAQFHTRS